MVYVVGFWPAFSLLFTSVDIRWGLSSGIGDNPTASVSSGIERTDVVVPEQVRNP